MKIYQALFLAAAVAKQVSAQSTAGDVAVRLTREPTGTRPAGASPTGLRVRTGTVTKDRTGTKPAGVTRDPTGTKPARTGTVTKDRTGTKPAGVTRDPTGTKPAGVTRDPTGTKPARTGTKPAGVTSDPESGDDEPERPDCQTAEGLDDRTKRYCCFKGIFTGDEKCPDGDKDRVPAECTKERSTTMAATTNTMSILDEIKKGLTCRPIRTEEERTNNEGDEEKAKEDPRRDTRALKEKAKDLSANGKRCVGILKRAIEAVKTQVQQWKVEPTRKPREDDDELEKDTVADTFYDAVEIAVAVEKLDEDFNEENIDKTAEELLPVKEGDEGAPKQCKAEWGAYKEELGALIEDFKTLPAKIKEDQAKLVKLALKDIDLGDVDWTNEQNVCRFAKALVTKMKEMQKSLRKKLQRIRSTLCTEGSKLAAGPKVGALARCLREKRKSNPVDADTNNEVYNRVRTKTNKIFGQIRSKCVAKPKDGDEDAEPVKPSTKTKRIIGMKIKKACKSAEDKQTCKDRVAAKIKAAIEAKNSDAKVEVSVTESSATTAAGTAAAASTTAAADTTAADTTAADTTAADTTAADTTAADTTAADTTAADTTAADTTSAGRRRLAEGDLAAQVTITETGAQPNPDYEAGVIAALGTTDVEVTSDSTEGTETITPPADVNMDIDDVTIPASTSTTLETAASAGSAAKVAMGAAAAVFVALVSVLL